MRITTLLPIVFVLVGLCIQAAWSTYDAAEEFEKACRERLAQVSTDTDAIAYDISLCGRMAIYEEVQP